MLTHCCIHATAEVCFPAATQHWFWAVARYDSIKSLVTIVLWVWEPRPCVLLQHYLAPLPLWTPHSFQAAAAPASASCLDFPALCAGTRLPPTQAAAAAAFQRASALLPGGGAGGGSGPAGGSQRQQQAGPSGSSRALKMVQKAGGLSGGGSGSGSAGQQAKKAGEWRGKEVWVWREVPVGGGQCKQPTSACGRASLGCTPPSLTPSAWVWGDGCGRKCAECAGVGQEICQDGCA